MYWTLVIVFVTTCILTLGLETLKVISHACDTTYKIADTIYNYQECENCGNRSDNGFELPSYEP